MALVILALGILALGIMTGNFVLTPISWYLFISKTLLYTGWGIFSIRDSAKILSEYLRKYN